MRQAEKALLSYHVSACWRSNNSFNRSGISLHVIRKTWMLGEMLPTRLIRALDGYIFMSESMRKFREGWRSYLLWGLLYALFIAPVIGIVLFSKEGEENKRYVP